MANTNAANDSPNKLSNKLSNKLTTKRKTINHFGFTVSETPNLDNTIDIAQSELPDLFSIARLLNGKDPNPKKLRKVEDLRPIAFLSLTSRRKRNKPIKLRALLDSGGSNCLIDEKFSEHLMILESSKEATTWVTPAGEMTTSKYCNAQIQFDELHPDRKIEWKFHVTPNLGSYDMISGRDMLQDLKIDIRFSTHEVEYDDAVLPFKEYEESELKDGYHIEDPPAVEESLDRTRCILDNVYEKSDLSKVTSNMK